jgi:Tfp pilus assembly protein PilN
LLPIEKTLLAVETAGKEICAAVVRRRGKRFEIVDFAAMRRPDPEDDLPSVDAVKALARRLGRAGGPAVFVTPMARAFDLLMDREKTAGLKHYQLAEAVRWEVEPYTGITGVNALVGVEPARRPEPLPGEVVYEDEDDQATFNVSAIERNVYRAIRERFRAAGFSLVRIYPPDVTFYMPLLMAPAEAPRAILEVGQDYSNFALVRGGVPEQINTLSLSLEAIRAHLGGETFSRDLEESLAFTVRQVPGPEPLVISGPGAADAAVVDFVAGFCAHGARPLELSRAAGLADARCDPAHAAYGSVVGAAVRELSGRTQRQAGIDDRVALTLRLKNSAYIAPLATVLVLVALLFGHYFWMKHKDTAYRARIETLTAQAKQRKAEVAQYEALIKEADRIQGQITFAEKRIAFMEGEADTVLIRMIEALNGISRAVDGGIVLTSLVQQPEHPQGGAAAADYGLYGLARDLAAVSGLADRLQAEPWCEAAVMRKLARSPAGGLDFELALTLRGEAG